MILIGRYLSPFVRRVAVTLRHLGIEHEQRALRAGGEEQDEVRKSNPLGRVPALILDDGSVLSDSAVIVDYLDSLVGPERALMPRSGPERFSAASDLSIANGAAEKAIAIYSERLRAPQLQDESYVASCARQAKDGFDYLDRAVAGPWMRGERLGQIDISVVCHLEFVRIGVAELFEQIECPALARLVEQARELDAFKETDPQA